MLMAGALAGVSAAGGEAPFPQSQEDRSAAVGAEPVFNVDLKGSVQFLASDDLEGRGIGTGGLDKAADFIAGNFRKLGLQPLPGQDDYFQHFKMTTATRPGPETALKFIDGDDAPAYEVGKDYTPLSFSGEKEFDAPIVFVGYSISNEGQNYDDYANVDVKGKVALAMRYEPHDNQGRSRFTGKESWSPSATLTVKARAAAAAGATALILVNPPAFHEDDDPLVPFARMYRGDQADIPIIQVRRAVADAWLAAAGANEGLRALQRKIDDAGKPASFALPEADRIAGKVAIERVETDLKNVVAMAPGRGDMAQEYVVVGAHYDHLGRGGPGSLAPQEKEIHNGADDNASGTAAMLKIAEHFARHRSDGRSLIFAAFSAEEVGLVGSQNFVTHPPAPLGQIAYMVNLDMVGRIRKDVLYIGGHGTAPVFEASIARADEKSPLHFKSFGKGGFGPSDHMSFAMKRIPVLFFHSGQHRDYHRPGDDADKVNYEGLEQAADFAADVVSDLLSAPREQYVSAADANSMFGGPGGTDASAPSMPSTGSASGGIRVSLGVVPDYAPDDEIKGLRISGTTPGSPADAAGLKEGDVITRIDNDKIASIYDLTAVLNNGKPGQKLKIVLLREGKRVEAAATLVARKSNPIDASMPHGVESERHDAKDGKQASQEKD